MTTFGKTESEGRRGCTVTPIRYAGAEIGRIAGCPHQTLPRVTVYSVHVHRQIIGSAWTLSEAKAIASLRGGSS